MKKFGITPLAVLPVRKEASDKSEMVTQLLFGDIFGILELNGQWAFIRNSYDLYEGWIDVRQIMSITPENFDLLLNFPFKVNRRLFGDFVMRGKEKIWLPAGCSLYLKNGVRVYGIGEGYLFQGEAYPFYYTSGEAIIETAKEYLGCPYLWGGKTYMGLDCSGFTQVVFKQHGIKLFRDAVQQANQGEPVSFISECLPGDLAFFDHEDGKISHAGIMVNPQRIIHCSGKVRIDIMDHQGIYNQEQKLYTHNLRLIKRVTA